MDDMDKERLMVFWFLVAVGIAIGIGLICAGMGK
jgi:hypothetical protein